MAIQVDVESTWLGIEDEYLIVLHLGLLTKWIARNQTGKPFLVKRQSKMKTFSYCTCDSLLSVNLWFVLRNGPNDAFGDGGRI